MYHPERFRELEARKPDYRIAVIEGLAKWLLLICCLGISSTVMPCDKNHALPSCGADSESSAVCPADTAKSQIIAAATLLIERKFIHQCGSVGHIEDVVVDQGYRGQRLGQRSVALLSNQNRGPPRGLLKLRSWWSVLLI